MEDESQKIILEEITKVGSNSMKKKLLNVKKLTNDREVIEKDYKKELLELQYSYEQKYKTIYDQASKIIHGQSEAEVSAEDVTKYNLVKPTSNGEVGIPDFWQKALYNAKYFYSNEKDETILKNLKDVRMEFKEDKISFSFILTFNPNPFFSNTEISKTYIFNNSQEIIKTESPTINWTSNELNPTKMLKKTQKKKGAKKVSETSSQWEDVESFFSSFKNENFEDPEADADINQEEEEAEFIREDLMPYALNYYLNIMPVEDDCGSCEEDDEDEDDHHGGHGHAKKGAKGKPSEAKEKCKNQ